MVEILQNPKPTRHRQLGWKNSLRAQNFSTKKDCTVISSSPSTCVEPARFCCIFRCPGCFRVTILLERNCQATVVLARNSAQKHGKGSGIPPPGRTWNSAACSATRPWCTHHVFVAWGWNNRFIQYLQLNNC